MEDIIALYMELGIDEEEFKRTYTDVVNKAFVLKSFPNGDCIFYDERTGCGVYNARPLQCRTFPFWPENLRRRSAWAKIVKFCPGSGTGEFHDKEEIERYLKLMREPYEY